MADEASVTIVARMRDEASAKMKSMGQDVKYTDQAMGQFQVTSANVGSTLTTTSQGIQQASFSLQQFQSTLIATGGALTAVGSLMSQLGGEGAKTAAIFVTTAGAIMSTTGAIISALPMIRSLITTLRSLAIVQAIVAALSGPVGWGKLAIGLGLAAGATAGIIALTRAGRGGADTGGAQVVNFNSQAFTGSQQDARKFSRQMNTIAREDTRLGR